MFVRLEQFQTVQFNLLPQRVQFIDGVLQVIGFFEVADKSPGFLYPRGPVTGKALPSFHQFEVPLNRSGNGVVVCFPFHEVAGMEFALVRKNNPFPPPFAKAV